MQDGDEASPSIILACLARLVKMLITLVPHSIFCSNFAYLCVQNGDEALSKGIILAGRALLMKMLIALESCGIYFSNFVYYCILKLSSRWYAKG